MTTMESPALARDRHTRTSPLWQVQAEILKIRTTKVWWLFLIAIVLITAWSLVRNGASHHYELHPPLDQYPAGERAQAAADAVRARTYAGHAAITGDMLTSGQFLGGLLTMLLGVLTVTNEYAHQTAMATFLANPRRGMVIGAKFAAGAGLGVLFWMVSTIINMIGTTIYIRSIEHFNMNFGDPVPLRSMLLNLLGYAMWAVFGVGLGTLFRAQVAAVITGLLVYLGGVAAVAAVFNLIYLAYHHTWVLGALVVAPAVASLVMITPGQAFEHAPPQWVGLLVMLGYTLVFGAVGVVRTRRREL
ncbi:MAG: ABC transporter permease subunit [Micromonosporaceae bacterium]|nr:ABC transporter permease subunit [Micromonosporaceae bacterium]